MKISEEFTMRTPVKISPWEIFQTVVVLARFVLTWHNEACLLPFLLEEEATESFAVKFKSSKSKLHLFQFSHQLQFVSQRQLLPIGCHQPTRVKAQICELPQLEDPYERSYGLLIKCQSLAEKTYLLIAKMGSLVLEGFSTLHYFVSLRYLVPALTTTTDP
jgi:hypothetical protein